MVFNFRHMSYGLWSEFRNLSSSVIFLLEITLTPLPLFGQAVEEAIAQLNEQSSEIAKALRVNPNVFPLDRVLTRQMIQHSEILALHLSVNPGDQEILGRLSLNGTTVPLLIAVITENQLTDDSPFKRNFDYYSQRSANSIDLKYLENAIPKLLALQAVYGTSADKHLFEFFTKEDIVRLRKAEILIDYERNTSAPLIIWQGHHRVIQLHPPRQVLVRQSDYLAGKFFARAQRYFGSRLTKNTESDNGIILDHENHLTQFLVNLTIEKIKTDQIRPLGEYDLESGLGSEYFLETFRQVIKNEQATNPIFRGHLQFLFSHAEDAKGASLSEKERNAIAKLQAEYLATLGVGGKMMTERLQTPKQSLKFSTLHPKTKLSSQEWSLLNSLDVLRQGSKTRNPYLESWFIHSDTSQGTSILDIRTEPKLVGYLFDSVFQIHGPSDQLSQQLGGLLVQSPQMTTRPIGMRNLYRIAELIVARKPRTINQLREMLRDRQSLDNPQQQRPIKLGRDEAAMIAGQCHRIIQQIGTQLSQ